MTETVSSTIQELENQLAAAPSAPEKADALRRLAWELRLSEPARAMVIATEAATLAEQCGYTSGLVQSLNVISATHLILGNYAAALEVAHRAMSLVEEGSPALAATVLNSVGVAYCKLCDYPAALDHHRRAIDLLRPLNENGILANSLNNIGQIYLAMSDYESALTYFAESLSLKESLGDRQGASNTLMNIGMVYSLTGKLPQAIDYLERALLMKQQLGDRRGEADSFQNLGVVYTTLGNYGAALENHTQCLRLRRQLGNRLSEAESLNNIGTIYYTTGDFRKAAHYFRDSLEVFAALGDRSGEGMCLMNLGSVAKDDGDVRAAQAYYAQSLNAFQAIENLSGQITVLHSMGILHRERLEFNEALGCLERSLSLSRMTGEKKPEGDALLDISLVYQDLFDDRSALAALQRALALAEETTSNELLYRVHQALATFYERTGEFQLAVGHLKRFHEAEKAVFNAESEQKTRSLMIQFEVESMQQQAKQQKIEAELTHLKNIELVQANVRLKEANRLKTEFISLAAHDLKNPLQTILGFADLTLERLTRDTESASYQHTISDAAKRMLKLIAKLLQNAELEERQLLFRKESVDLGLLAQSVVASMVVQAERKSQQLFFTADADALILADAELMREVIDNLISNAVKYSPHGKTIWIEVRTVDSEPFAESADETIRSEPTAKRVQLRVKDEGQGLTESDKKKMFGKFQRLSARPTDGESSTGLGLAIVKQLVELHNGKIWAESDGQGKGAAFIAELPAVKVMTPLEKLP